MRLPVNTSKYLQRQNNEATGILTSFYSPSPDQNVPGEMEGGRSAPMQGSQVQTGYISILKEQSTAEQR